MATNLTGELTVVYEIPDGIEEVTVDGLRVAEGYVIFETREDVTVRADAVSGTQHGTPTDKVTKVRVPKERVYSITSVEEEEREPPTAETKPPKTKD